MIGVVHHRSGLKEFHGQIQWPLILFWVGILNLGFLEHSMTNIISGMIMEFERKENPKHELQLVLKFELVSFESMHEDVSNETVVGKVFYQWQTLKSLRVCVAFHKQMLRLECTWWGGVHSTHVQ
ncbi:hypothetical protein VNO77_08073 [Canavalia gladiata]|uniref:Uncharacterized protein n=1 Tax=Canavalia gladiata TaxID=3824 RepID=A0AAN9M867_CANGL